jgi:hypothetical protein
VGAADGDGVGNGVGSGVGSGVGWGVGSGVGKAVGATGHHNSILKQWQPDNPMSLNKKISVNVAGSGLLYCVTCPK